jgi:hypothetical protein
MEGTFSLNSNSKGFLNVALLARKKKYIHCHK